MRGRGGHGRRGVHRRVQGGMPCWGGGKVFVARGRAGLTGQRQRRLVPPGFLLKTQPPPPPQASLLRLHSLLHFPLSSFCSFPPSPSACSLSPAPFLHFSHFFFFSSPHFSSGPLQTLSSRLRGGGGWLRRWDEEIEGHKSPEMQWSDESGWL